MLYTWSHINLSVLTHMVLTDDFVIIPRLRRYPRSAKPFGLRNHGTNPRWRWFFYFKQNPTILRSFGPKSDDFKISEVGERLFKILRWKLDFFEKNKFLRILGQKPTKQEFWNFRKNFKNIFSRTFQKKHFWKITLYKKIFGPVL